MGMCFGVRDAIALARGASTGGGVTVLGHLVHNPAVLADLEAEGIRSVERVEEAPPGAVMITAHGTSERALSEVRATGRVVLEGTCPLVHVAHRALRELVLEGRFPVVVGKRDHVEVRGLTGDYDPFGVVLTEEEVDALPAHPRYGVVAQTTQPIARVRGLVARLRGRFPEADVRFTDTVCQPTKLRQSSAVSLAKRCDVVLVIGGVASNNTRELVATCLEHCPRVYPIQGAADLRGCWFRGDETVGITAGTSTPDASIEEVEKWLAQFQDFQARVAAVA